MAMAGFLRMKAKGARVRRVPGEMNGLERKYAEHLELRKLAGEIADWRFDELKLRIAPNTFYTPDFFVLMADATIEIIEVKGHWEDDARVKIKVASDKFWWFRFCAITARRKRDGGGWNCEWFE